MSIEKALGGPLPANLEGNLVWTEGPGELDWDQVAGQQGYGADQLGGR
jgi:hypothetical protein